MWSSIKRFILLFLAIGLGVGAYIGYSRFSKFIQTDYLARMRLTANPNKEKISLIFEKVRYHHYNREELLASARIDRVEVDQSRRFFRAVGLKNGIVYSKSRKNNVGFDAKVGVWSVLGKSFEIKDGAHIFGKDFDVHVPSFAFNEQSREITVPGQVVGRLRDGSVKAIGITFNMTNNFFTVGPATWFGQVDAPLDDKQAKKKSKWTIKSQGISSQDGDLMRLEKAEATDGEVVVKSDFLERNIKTDVITATGNVQYFSKEANMLCEKAVVDRKIKKATLEGNVSILVKSKDEQKLEVVPLQPFHPEVPPEVAENRPTAPPTEQDKEIDKQLRSSDNWKKYPVMVYCMKVEYWYEKGKRHALISGTPQARQEFPAGRWRQIWGSQANYDVENEVLRIDGNIGLKDARMRTSLGDDLIANWFQVSTKEGDKKWSAEDAEGVMVPDDEDMPDELRSGEGGSSTGGASGTGGTTGGDGKPGGGFRLPAVKGAGR